MAFYRNLKMTSKIVLPVGIMLILALGGLTWAIQSKTSEAIQRVAERELAALAGQYGNDSKAFFENALNKTQALADALTSTIEKGSPPSRSMLLNMLNGISQGDDSFLSAGAAWDVNTYDRRDFVFANTPGSDANGRFIPYVLPSGEVTLLDKVDQSSFYSDPKKRNRTYLTLPYFYNVDGKEILMTTACAVVKKNNQFQGIILINISLETVAKMVNNIKVYDTGWAAVLTQNGTVVGHKNPSLIQKNLFDTEEVGDKTALKNAMEKGDSFVETHFDGTELSFYYYYPIHFNLTGQTWYFVVSAPLDEVLSEVADIRSITMGISAGVLLLALLLIFVVVRINVKPLGYLADTAKEISKGNLDVTINDASFGGEIKELSTSFKEMITSLVENIDKAEAMSEDAKAQAEKAQVAMREAEAAQKAAEGAKREGMLAAAAQLEDVVSVVSSASEQLSAQIAQSEKGAAAQAASVGETATAMEEMNSTVLEVARSASTASEVTNETREKAEQGSQIVQRAVQSIQDVQEVAHAMKEDMETLAEQAEAISDIMSVISDIADQTNLLALNAAIEAARAGEYGRGFAVVADEVRKLAEKTMTSTHDVGNAISSIQKSVQQSMSQTDKAAELVAIATGHSNESGKALTEIVSMVESAADQVRSIATASEEQSATSEEINRSISEVNHIAEETVVTMQEATKAVNELAEQTYALSELIEEMKNS